MASRARFRSFRLPAAWPPALLFCLLVFTAGCRGGATVSADGLPPRLVDLNLAGGGVFERAWQDSVLAAEAGAGRPTAERVAAWARRFHEAGRSSYLFGLAEGGYAASGRLALDERHDCISLMYRCTELARASNTSDALAVALATRFAGAAADSVIAADGRVDYDRPEHLDFSLDMIRTGHWGQDVTASLPGSVLDETGSSRYAAGSFRYLPTAALSGEAGAASALREGDIAWLVLDPANGRARALRDEYGLVIGHVGVVVLRDGEPWLIHAGGSALPGYYDEGGVVSAPLGVYLERVEKFGGAVITRMK